MNILSLKLEKSVLIIGFVWPEPNSTANGRRIMQLLQFFINNGFKTYFTSAANRNEHSDFLEEMGVFPTEIKLNDSDFKPEFMDINPEFVIYDRFLTEEMFGWKLRELWTDFVSILDTEDLHFLRKARETAYKKNQTIDYYSLEAQREIASILRCDLSLIISEFEMNFLIEKFNISPKILYYLPFLENSLTTAEIYSWKSWEERKDFVFIGNFHHEPNWQTVLYLKKHIWPILRKKLPQSGLYIYGAYMAEKHKQLHNPKENFFMMGRAEVAKTTIGNYRIMLAPIPLGAGIKGKFIDAMQTGTPSVSSSIGAESMKNDEIWAGKIADSDDEFVAAAELLYLDKIQWEMAQKNGLEILEKRFAKELYEENLFNQLLNLKKHIRLHRRNNFIGEILKSNQNNYLKYMSLWIEQKERNR